MSTHNNNDILCIYENKENNGITLLCYIVCLHQGYRPILHFIVAQNAYIIFTHSIYVYIYICLVHNLDYHGNPNEYKKTP